MFCTCWLRSVFLLPLRQTRQNDVESIEVVWTKSNSSEMTALTASITDIAVGVSYSSVDVKCPKSLAGDFDDDSNLIYIALQARRSRPLFAFISRLLLVPLESDRLSGLILFLWTSLKDSALCAKSSHETGWCSDHLRMRLRQILLLTASAKRSFSVVFTLTY